MELLARKKLLKHFFLFVKFYMNPLVIVDIIFFVFHWAVQLWFEPYLLFFHALTSKMFKYIFCSNMELLARIKLLRHLFLFVKLHMDPLGIVNINFFVFLVVQLWFEHIL